MSGTDVLCGAVMTEGDLPSGGNWKFFCTIALLLIDSLQVLRSMAVSKFMWTGYSISVMRSIDLVSLFFTAVGHSRTGFRLHTAWAH